MKKLLMVGRTRYQLPLNDTLRAKFDALRKVFDLRVLASRAPGSPAGDETFELGGPWRPRRLDGALYFATLPFRTAKELRRSRPDAVLVQGAHETWLVLQGRRLARSRAPVVLDIHGDWRSSTRLYGSPRAAPAEPARRPRSPSRRCGMPTPCGRSPTTRPGSSARSASSRRPCSRRSWTSTRSSARSQPLPSPPRALFVGVLEHYKGIEGSRRPGATSRRACPASTCTSSARGRSGRWPSSSSATCPAASSGPSRFRPRASRRRSTPPRCSLLPSRSEGLGRVRRRGVLPRARRSSARASAASSTSSATARTACSSPPQDPAALADALVPRAHGPRARRAARRGRASRAPRRGWRARGVRRAPGSARRRTTTRSHARRPASSSSLKNGVYRALGETATGVGALNGDEARTLRVLMYHKVNDVPENPVDGPGRRGSTSRWRSSRELGYTPVDARRRARLLPRRHAAAAAGGADHLRRRLPRQPRERGAGAAALRLPGRASSSRSATSAARAPLPHDEHLAARGIVNPTARLGGARASSRRRGVRVESHGIGHRPLADLEVDEAAREIALSKLRLEERLGRPVRAFAYVKGSEAHYRPVHLSLAQAGGLRRRVHVGLGRRTARRPTRCSCTATTSSRTRRARSSSCSPGACDLIAVKDTVAGTHARRIFNAALGTSTK